MEDHEKSPPELAREAEAREEKWFDGESNPCRQREKTKSDAPPAPDALDNSRYEFPIPSMAIFDLLGIQLAECTRITRTLADDIVVRPYTSQEVSPIVKAFETVARSSAVIADTMDLVQNGRPRLPGPDRSGRS